MHMASTNNTEKVSFFKRMGRGIAKFWRSYVSEMKKVVWMPKSDVWKNTVMVVATVLAFSVAIAIVDVTFSEIINGIAGLIG